MESVRWVSKEDRTRDWVLEFTPRKHACSYGNYGRSGFFFPYNLFQGWKPRAQAPGSRPLWLALSVFLPLCSRCRESGRASFAFLSLFTPLFSAFILPECLASTRRKLSPRHCPFFCCIANYSASHPRHSPVCSFRLPLPHLGASVESFEVVTAASRAVLRRLLGYP